MTHEEMSNFTHEEISCFTHYELALDKLKLLYKILSNENIEISEDILKKLHAVCSNTISDIEKSSKISIPQRIKNILTKFKPSQKELSSVVKFIIKLLISSLIASGVKSVSVKNLDFNFSKESVKTTYYISNGELDNDMNIIIEEIKKSTNIDISLDDVEVDWNSEE